MTVCDCYLHLSSHLEHMNEDNHYQKIYTKTVFIHIHAHKNQTHEAKSHHAT